MVFECDEPPVKVDPGVAQEELNGPIFLGLVSLKKGADYIIVIGPFFIAVLEIFRFQERQV